MKCPINKEDLLLYLYDELSEKDQEKIEKHLETCLSCGEILQEMAQVYRVLGNDTPSQKEKARKILHLPKAWVISGCAATFLGGIVCGWWSNLPQNNIQLEKQASIVSLLEQNQRYRKSLSPSQFFLTQEMEKHLAELAQVTSEIDFLHQLEGESDPKKTEELTQVTERFIQNHPDSPLLLPLYRSLAKNFQKRGKAEEAISYYKKLLTKTSLVPEERGEYIWHLAECQKTLGKKNFYYQELEKLEKESIYGSFHWQAIKVIADRDFYQGNFFEARSRYLKYQNNKIGKSPEASERVHWINFHEKDNFYPLLLFVEAQKKGVEAFYGLKVILSQYPDSPLAWPAFEMYLSDPKSPITYFSQVSLPKSWQKNALLPYLEHIQTITELKEVASFAEHWKEVLQNPSQKSKETLSTYQEFLKKKDKQKRRNL